MLRARSDVGSLLIRLNAGWRQVGKSLFFTRGRASVPPKPTAFAMGKDFRRLHYAFRFWGVGGLVQMEANIILVRSGPSANERKPCSPKLFGNTFLGNAKKVFRNLQTRNRGRGGFPGRSNRRSLRSGSIFVVGAFGGWRQTLRPWSEAKAGATRSKAERKGRRLCWGGAEILCRVDDRNLPGKRFPSSGGVLRLWKMRL